MRSIDPAVAAESLFGLDPVPGDAGGDAPGVQVAADVLVVVALVVMQVARAGLVCP